MVLSIYPRLDDASTDTDREEHLRFQKELSRIKHLVDQAPKYDENRQLDRAADSMPQDKKDEFLRAGNELLVNILASNHYNNLILETCAEFQSFSWWANGLCS